MFDFFSINVMAADLSESKKVLVEVDQLIYQKDFKQAFENLSLLYPEYSSDPEFDLLYAIVANEVGQYGRAILALERVLTLQPDNSRARAEIARSYYLQGEYQSSQNQFDIARATTVDEKSAWVIENYLSEIRHKSVPDDAPLFFGHVQITTGYDSNVSQGLNDESITLPILGQILEFIVNPEALEKSDAFTEISANLNYRHPISSEWIFHSSADLSHKYNQEYNLYDIGNYSVRAGMDYRYEKHLFTGIYQYGRYDYLDREYQNSDSVLLQWQNSLDARHRVSFYYQWQQMKYPGIEYQNADRNTLGVGITKSLQDVPLGLHANIYLSEEQAEARDNLLDFIDYGFIGGARYNIQNDITLYANLMLQEKEYEKQNQLFLVTREDTYLSSKIGLIWTLQKDLQAELQYQYSRNDSNIAVNEYDRHVTSASLKWGF